MPETKKLSLEPYKGTRDFYPQDEFVQNYIFSVWRKVAQSYGYLEYNASILEETELYKAKSGEEIVNEQTYSFTDRGGRDVTIRPEMTPTVARMVAQKRKELAFPLRWFSIPNLFRYERPQRGRLREHWQLNVDMFGADSLEADMEIISVAYGIMRAFGARDEQFSIKLNSRKLINFLMREHYGLNAEQSHVLSKLIDRKSKIPHEEFSSQAEVLLGERFDEFNRLLEFKTVEDLPEEIRAHESARQLERAITQLRERGIENLVFDLSLMRGFDYYTGIVFEVFDNSPENPRSLFGGGRYDDLVGLFGVEKVPGVGFGVGDVGIRNYLETYNLLPEYKPAVDLYICQMGEEFLPYANELAAELRSQGVNVAVDLTARKVSAQVKTADREKVPFILVIGEEEAKSGTFKLKNLAASTEQEVKWEEIIKIVKGK